MELGGGGETARAPAGARRRSRPPRAGRALHPGERGAGRRRVGRAAPLLVQQRSAPPPRSDRGSDVACGRRLRPGPGRASRRSRPPHALRRSARARPPASGTTAMSPTWRRAEHRGLELEQLDGAANDGVGRRGAVEVAVDPARCRSRRHGRAARRGRGPRTGPRLPPGAARRGTSRPRGRAHRRRRRRRARGARPAVGSAGPPRRQWPNGFSQPSRTGGAQSVPTVCDPSTQGPSSGCGNLQWISLSSIP